MKQLKLTQVGFYTYLSILYKAFIDILPKDDTALKFMNRMLLTLCDQQEASQ